MTLCGRRHGQGEYAEADTYFLRTIEILRRSGASYHAELAAVLNSRASCLREQVSEWVLRLVAGSGAHEWRWTEVTTLFPVPSALESCQGKREEADTVCLRAVMLLEKIKRLCRPSVVGVLNSLAGLLREQVSTAVSVGLYCRIRP